jgi:FKBP-type peptidyl-prolyl cis-trans isomerase 2
MNSPSLFYEAIMRFSVFSVICFLILCGCTGHSAITHSDHIKGGEWINIEYTCRTPNDELAATSHRDVAENTSLPHSPLFKLLNNYLPAITTVAHPQDTTIPLAKTMCFEEMLELLLTRQALGKPINTQQTMTLQGELIPNINGGDRFLQMNLAYQTNRKNTNTLAEFKATFKTDPVIGKQYMTDSTGLSGTVVAVDGDSVTMVFNAAPETFHSSPFGSEKITQIGDKLEFRTDTQKGLLVRSGPAIGMVTEVNDTTFTIDYGHSFGFTPLTCEVVYQPYTSPDGQEWSNNLNYAAEESSKSGKYMLVHFHDQWSGPSRTFLTEVLPDPKVIAATSKYIRVQVSIVGRFSLLEKYDVTTMPTMLVIDSHGKIIKKINGLPTSDEFADGLEQLLETTVNSENRQ